MAAIPAVHGAQLQELKQQMASLTGGLLPAVGRMTEQAKPPLQRVMGYAELAAEYAPQVSSMLDMVLKRGGAAAETAVAATGWKAHVVRNRVLLTGLAIGAGLLAYDMWGGKLTALVKESMPEA